MKKLNFLAYLLLIFITMHSNSYAATIKYTGVAYWGKTPFASQFPSLYGIPAPTILTEGVAEDVLGQYLTQNNSIYYRYNTAYVYYCIAYSKPDASGNFYCRYNEIHFALIRTVYCNEPNLPRADFRSCIAPPPPPEPEPKKDIGPPPPLACPSPTVGGKN